MQKLSRTGAYAGWCLAIALVGVIFISLVHDVDADNHPAGGGEPAHWVAVNTARGAVETQLNGLTSQASASEAFRAVIITQLQDAWTAYNDALDNATMQDALHDMLRAKEQAEAEVTSIQNEIADLCPGGLAASTNDCLQ